jgi:hypothetical protein
MTHPLEDERSATVLVALRKPDTVDDAAFTAWLVGTLGDALLAPGRTYAVVVATEPTVLGGSTDGAPVIHALAWAEAPLGVVDATLAAAVDDGHLGGWTRMLVAAQRSFRRSGGVYANSDEPTPGDDRFADLPGTAAPGLRRISFHGPPAGVDRSAYRALFLEHCGLTEQHMGNAWQYRQDEIDDVDGPDAWPVEGVSEFWASTPEHLATPYLTRDDARAVGGHSKSFVDGGRSVTVRGVEVVRHG